MSVKLAQQGTRPALSCPARSRMLKTIAATVTFDLSNFVAEPIIGRHYWASPGSST